MESQVNRLTAEAQRALFRVRRRARVTRNERLFIESARGVAGAEAYAGMHHLSLAASSIRPGRAAARSISVLVPEVHPSSIFAGVRTALEIAAGLANELQLPLRIVTLSAPLSSSEVNTVRQFLLREFALASYAEADVIPISALASLAVNENEVWLATHWTTALPLDVAARIGLIRPDQVIYIVQDYEPGFSAWSSDYALARSTYDAGFRVIVNSAPLAAYLTKEEDLGVDPSLVFAPSLDLGRLEESAEARKRAPDVRVLFYGRPSKPRNLFSIGVTTLKLAASSLKNERVSYSSAGESHGPVQLGSTSLTSLGKLSWEKYFSELGNSDVILSLQLSPHPSHPPLDAVVSGAYAVTNELSGTRSHLHPRLLTAEPYPRDLAEQVVRAVELSQSEGPASFDSSFISSLGSPLSTVITTVADQVK